MKTTIEKLIAFVRQRPGLEYCNYGDIASYRKEKREITADLRDFYELLSLAQLRIDNLEQKITDYLKNTSGRLKLNDLNELEYCTGQYFPTEYRPAVNRILSNLIWNSFTDEIHETANDKRKAIKKRVSRRLMRYYFS